MLETAFTENNWEYWITLRAISALGQQMRQVNNYPKIITLPDRKIALTIKKQKCQLQIRTNSVEKVSTFVPYSKQDPNVDAPDSANRCSSDCKNSQY